MIVIGILLLVVGYLIGIHLLMTLGWVLLAVGLVLLVLGAVGVGVGGPVNGRWF